MDFITKQKTYFWLIIILVILNVTILIMLWTDRHEFPPEIKERPPIERFLADELKLTLEQQNLFNKYRDEHFSQIKSLMQQIDVKKESIFDEIFRKEPDHKKINSLIDSIGILNTRLEGLRFEHFLKLKSVLNETQYSKFRKMIDETMQPKPGNNMPPPPPQFGKGNPMPDDRPPFPQGR